MTLQQWHADLIIGHKTQHAKQAVSVNKHTEANNYNRQKLYYTQTFEKSKTINLLDDSAESKYQYGTILLKGAGMKLEVNLYANDLEVSS